MRCLGALLLLLTCGGSGIRYSRELRQRVELLQETLRKLERLQMEVCRLLTPLPEVLFFLTGRALAVSEWQERPFAEIWCREVATLGLASPERTAMEELGRALCRGDEPERAFLAAQERLRALLASAAAEAEEKCRLSSSLGICSGLLLAIVLI